jgi:enoyl-CoA hydratase
VEEPHALIERRGHVLIVTMNRPQARNALSGPMMELMRQAWDTVDSDPERAARSAPAPTSRR